MQDSVEQGATVPLGSTENNRVKVPPDPGEIRSGAVLGRYLAIEESGRGGMGTVIRAYDPKLQREVALKLLRISAMSEDARARLVREARAMAQLSHPNVVAVYDVDVDAISGVMLAMEYVRGRTLQQWAKDGEHPWWEIVDVFVQAGRGLAAAHAVGLMHRDFKPANVLVGDDARVRVTDFGLARAPRPTESIEDLRAVEPGEREAFSSRTFDGLALTSESVVLGTPPYMAPEQHGGETLTVGADQYAFCIALWEALTGALPFTGRISAIRAAKLKGPPPWPRPAKAPRRIVRALRRGLAPLARDRWPTMDALLRELQSTTRARHRARWIALGGTATVLVGAAAWGGGAFAEQPCTGARERLEASWGDDRRASAQSALLATGVPYAEATWHRVAAQLDGWADEWTQMHRDACEATEVRREQSAELLDLRMACLRRAQLDLDATVDLLANADAQVVETADRLVEDLPGLARCADPEALRSAGPQPRDAGAVEADRARLAQARAFLTAGKNEDAAAIVDELHARIDAIEYEPLRTEVWLALGSVRSYEAKYEPAITAYQEVVRTAPRLHQWDEACTAALQLALVEGERLVRPESALPWLETARGECELATDPEEARLETRSLMGVIRHAQGDYAAAEREHQAVLDAYLAMESPDPMELADARSSLANALFFNGKPGESLEQHRLALTDLEATYGDSHPVIATARTNIANALAAQGRFADAEAEHRAALAMRVAMLGSEHLDVSDSRNSLAQALHGQGKFAEAEAELRAALALRVAAMGPDDPNVAMILNNLPAPLIAQGKLAEAEQTLRETIAIYERTLGPDHIDAATARANLALVLQNRGNLGEAEATLRRALAVWERSLAPDHGTIALGRRQLAELLLERRGDRGEALALLEPAWAVIQRGEQPDYERAATAFALARALGETDRDRAESLAREAMAAWTDESAECAEFRASVAAWLAAH